MNISVCKELLDTGSKGERHGLVVLQEEIMHYQY